MILSVFECYNTYAQDNTRQYHTKEEGLGLESQCLIPFRIKRLKNLFPVMN